SRRGRTRLPSASLRRRRKPASDRGARPGSGEGERSRATILSMAKPARQRRESASNRSRHNGFMSMRPVATPLEPYTITLRPGNPGLLELDWARSIADWTTAQLVDLPRGISRHTVRFVAFDRGTYPIKERPLKPPQRDSAPLGALGDVNG